MSWPAPSRRRHATHRAGDGSAWRAPGSRRARAALATAIAASIALALVAAPPSAAAGAGVAPPRIGGSLELNGIVRLDASSPRQHPQARIDLHGEQRLSRRLRWRLSAIGLWGGPPDDPRAGVFNLDETFQNFSPSLELDDAYVAWSGESIDLRLGKQKLFWGRLDAIQPNDLLNPRQYQDPLLDDEKRAKIAVPAIAATWLFPPSWRGALPEESRLAVVWEPIDVPWRFPLLEERWFAPAALAEDRISVGAHPGTPCPCEVSVDQEVRNASAPGRDLGNGNLGIRLSGRSHGTDWALAFFEGFDPTPNFDVTVSVAPSTVPAGGGPVAVASKTVLRPAYRRFQSLGADAAMPVGPLTVRAEGAWRFRRPYPFTVREVTGKILEDPAALARLVAGEAVEMPAFVERDAVEWGVGADTVLGDFIPLLELFQTILLHNDQRLLIRDVDTRLTANLRRRWMSDRLEGQVLFVWGIESGYQMLRTQLDYTVLDGLQLIAGVLGIWGDRNSIIGQYRQNGEVYTRVRYSF